MKTRIWIIVVTALLLCSVADIAAQTKYEYATLRYFGDNSTTKELRGLTFTTKSEIQVINAKPENPWVELEKKATQLSTEGWEVYQVTAIGGVTWFCYHMRRKIE